MLQRIQNLLVEVPFRPFVVLTSAGKSYRVASPDHANISPSKTRLHIWFDDEGATEISALYIVSVEYEAPTVAQGA